MALRDEMRKLMRWIWSRAEAKGYGTGDHHVLYHETALEFDLYDSEDHEEPSAPIWLSRIVAGVLQDRAEGLTPNDY